MVWCSEERSGEKIKVVTLKDLEVRLLSENLNFESTIRISMHRDQMASTAVRLDCSLSANTTFLKSATSCSV